MEEKYEDILKNAVKELKRVLGKKEDNQRRDERIERLRIELQENDEIENWNAFYQGEEKLENDFNKEESIEELKQLLEQKNKQEREFEDIRNRLDEVEKNKKEKIGQMDTRIEELRVGLQENDEIEKWKAFSQGENNLENNFNKERSIEELKQLLIDRDKIEEERSTIEKLTQAVISDRISDLYNIIDRYYEKFKEETSGKDIETTDEDLEVETDEIQEDSIRDVIETQQETIEENDVELQKATDYEEDPILTIEDLADRENVVMKQGEVYIKGKRIEEPTIGDMNDIVEIQEQNIEKENNKTDEYEPFKQTTKSNVKVLGMKSRLQIIVEPDKNKVTVYNKGEKKPILEVDDITKLYKDGKKIRNRILKNMPINIRPRKNRIDPTIISVLSEVSKYGITDFRHEYIKYIEEPNQESRIDEISYIFDKNAKEEKKVRKELSKCAKTAKKYNIAKVEGIDTRNWFTKIKDWWTAKRLVSNTGKDTNIQEQEDITNKPATAKEEREELVKRMSNIKQFGYKVGKAPQIKSSNINKENVEEKGEPEL